MMDNIKEEIEEKLQRVDLELPSNLFFKDGSSTERGEDGIYIYLDDRNYVYLTKERGQILKQNKSMNKEDIVYLIIQNIITEEAIKRMVKDVKSGLTETQQVMILSHEKILFKKIGGDIGGVGLRAIQEIVDTQHLHLIER